MYVFNGPRDRATASDAADDDGSAPRIGAKPRMAFISGSASSDALIISGDKGEKWLNCGDVAKAACGEAGWRRQWDDGVEWEVGKKGFGENKG